MTVALQAALDLYLALLVWGTLGLALAVLTRSAGIAIGVGVGWVLLLESVIAAALDDVADWMPGATIGALAAGGTDAMATAELQPLLMLFDSTRNERSAMFGYEQPALRRVRRRRR